MKKCKHYWSYEHTVYGDVYVDGGDTITVHRQCSNCGIHQIASTSEWKKPHKDSYELPELISK